MKPAAFCFYIVLLFIYNINRYYNKGNGKRNLKKD